MKLRPKKSKKNSGLSSEMGISSSLGLCWVEFLSVFFIGICLDWFCGMFVKMEMLGFQKSCYQKILKTPVFVLTIG